MRHSLDSGGSAPPKTPDSQERIQVKHQLLKSKPSPTGEPGHWEEVEGNTFWIYENSDGNLIR